MTVDPRQPTGSGPSPNATVKIGMVRDWVTVLVVPITVAFLGAASMAFINYMQAKAAEEQMKTATKAAEEQMRTALTAQYIQIYMELWRDPSTTPLILRTIAAHVKELNRQKGGDLDLLARSRSRSASRTVAAATALRPGFESRPSADDCATTQGTSECVEFSDDYAIVVADTVVGWMDGPPGVEIALGRKAAYHHVLGTDLLRIVPE